jgi:hypothetical protein
MLDDSLKERIPIIQDFHVFLIENTIIGHSIISLQTRHSKTSGSILSCKNVVGLSCSVYIRFGRDVEDGAFMKEFQLLEVYITLRS